MTDQSQQSSPTFIRRTLATRASVRGVGLFTGLPSSLTIAPATGPDSSLSGIVLRRLDLPGAPDIPSLARHIAPERRRTLLVAGADVPAARAEAHTVEHVLSALAGLGITDALLELSGPEVPIGDGSATPFVDAILAAGIVTIAEVPFESACITIRAPIEVSDGTGTIRAEHSDTPGCEMIYELDYGPAAPIPAQRASAQIEPAGGIANYRSALARARTFCLLEEAVAMRKMGLFQGFEPRDLLVIGPDGPVDNSYRYDNEPARHKLLDLVGDLSLAGRPVQGRMIATRSGHALNHQMARALASLAD
ncbi:MAG: UDP-3-O-acyl-N-acetylglucosamine deacetylase [Phycisphaerales bacterium]